MDAGLLTQGQVVALYNYMSQILVELIKMANLDYQHDQGRGLRRTASRAVLDMPAGRRKAGRRKRRPRPDCARGIPRTCCLHNIAGAAEDSLTDLTFRVPRGQTVGVIGGTGSGKSSLVNLIPRFYDATGGQVLVNGAGCARLGASGIAAAHRRGAPEGGIVRRQYSG